MRFTRRVCGLENEFGVVVQEEDGTLVPVVTKKNRQMHRYGESIHVRQIENSIVAKDAHGRYRVWHSNGGSSYVDTGYHPEYNTPECIRAYDAVRYSKAGERIFRIMFDYKNLDNSRFLLFKNNCGYDPEILVPGIDDTYGCHENYSVHNCNDSAQDTMEKLRQFIPTIPFFATRQIFDGNGWWNSKGNFYLSPRAYAISEPFSHCATGERGILQLRTGDTGSGMRLHVIVGDANICEFALYLKMGATLLVLDLLKSGVCPSFHCINPIQALHHLCRSSDAALPLFIMQNGSKMTALDIQAAYLDAVSYQLRSADFDDEATEEEVRTTVRYWEQALNAIANHDYEWMQGRMDYATKIYLADQLALRKHPSCSAEMLGLKKNMDIHYHNISDSVLQQRMNMIWPERRVVGERDIEDAMLNPPCDTRAVMRGGFIKELLNKGYTSARQMDWYRLFSDHTLFDMPFGDIAYKDGFNEFLAQIADCQKSESVFSLLI